MFSGCDLRAFARARTWASALTNAVCGVSTGQQLTASCSEISQICHQTCTATHAESAAVDQHPAPTADSTGSQAGLVPQSASYLDMYRSLSCRGRNNVAHSRGGLPKTFLVRLREPLFAQSSSLSPRRVIVFMFCCSSRFTLRFGVEQRPSATHVFNPWHSRGGADSIRRCAATRVRRAARFLLHSWCFESAFRGMVGNALQITIFFSPIRGMDTATRFFRIGPF